MPGRTEVKDVSVRTRSGTMRETTECGCASISSGETVTGSNCTFAVDLRLTPAFVLESGALKTLEGFPSCSFL
jgi:hypothetical protein